MATYEVYRGVNGGWKRVLNEFYIGRNGTWTKVALVEESTNISFLPVNSSDVIDTSLSEESVMAVNGATVKNGSDHISTELQESGSIAVTYLATTSSDSLSISLSESQEVVVYSNNDYVGSDSLSVSLSQTEEIVIIANKIDFEYDDIVTVVFLENSELLITSTDTMTSGYVGGYGSPYSSEVSLTVNSIQSTDKISFEVLSVVAEILSDEPDSVKAGYYGGYESPYVYIDPANTDVYGAEGYEGDYGVEPSTQITISSADDVPLAVVSSAIVAILESPAGYDGGYDGGYDDPTAV